MKQVKGKSTAKRRNRDDIFRLLAEFKRTNPEVKAFCNLHKISRATFYKWQSRYNLKKKAVGLPAGFARLRVSSLHESASSILFAEVNGIKIYQQVDASYLKELLQ